jgi:hypothetical protein
MIRAFGYCNDAFDPTRPGRLCRGRERWLDGLPTAPSELHRTVLSGAVFSDDSARDAQRGYRFAGVPAGPLLTELFPGREFLAFCEAGDARALPHGALLEEDWTRSVRGGSSEEPAVRWVARPSQAEVDAWLEGEVGGLACPRADALIVRRKAASVSEPLLAAIYALIGLGDADDHPSRRYCPTAIPDVLEHADALVLFHLDKHAPAVSIYTRAPLESDGVIDLAARAVGAFPVPFAIPPMLARWDRALYELRMDWDPDRDGEFPVPPADDAGGRWSARGRRRVETPTETAEE